MFLFTTPTPKVSEPRALPVLDAIRQGAERTGTGFEYLLDTAKRESALDPSAKAPTSSATGLFQFIEQTWLGLVKSEGEKAGIGDEAKAVIGRGDGGFTVADPAARQAILKLREDPTLASHMAGALTRQNRDALVAATGREPSSGELYMAHVLGARGASDLIDAAQRQPARVAAADFPEAARANRNIFYERSGRPRGAGEVYAVLAASHGARPGAGTGATVPDAAPEPPAAQPPGLIGLFQTGARPGPISDAVARIWRVNNDGARTRTAGLPYFPRSVPLETVPGGEAAEASALSATPDGARDTQGAARTPDSAGPAAPLAITVTRRAGATATTTPPALQPTPAPALPPLPPPRPRAALGAGPPLSLSAFMGAART